MSLVRAFTMRRHHDSVPTTTTPHCGRAASQRNGRPVKRSQISAPLALLSTTNPLSYDAPDIAGTAPVRARSMTATSSTADESDAPSLSFDGADASSIDETPATPVHNHLSCYFRPAVDTKTGNPSPSLSTRSSWDAPNIPQRVPSHSKKAHEIVHRQRSVRRMMSSPVSPVRRESTDFFGNWSPPTETPLESPFGNELAQLDAVAEEMTHVVRDAEDHEDRYVIQKLDLACHGADEYRSDIHHLVSDFLADEQLWI